MRSKRLLVLLAAALCLAVAAPAWAHSSGAEVNAGGDVIGRDPSLNGGPIVRMAPGSSIPVTVSIMGTWTGWTIYADKWGYNGYEVTDYATHAAAGGVFTVNLIEEHQEGGFSRTPPHFSVILTANANAPSGEYLVELKSRNLGSSQEEGAPGRLKIVLVNNQAQPAVIDGGQSVKVVPGGSATVTFTGQNIRSWTYKTLPDGIEKITLSYADNPNRCDVTVTASEGSQARSVEMLLYAYNGAGGETSAPLNVTIEPQAVVYPDPEINAPATQSVTVAPGGSVRTRFTGRNIKSWGYTSLPDGVKSVQLNYGSDPSDCDVIVTASKEAAGSCSLSVYAYNEVGERATATVNVTFSAVNMPAPVISTTSPSVSVIPGGSAQTVLKGTNIVFWYYQQLPTEVKSVEFRYNYENSDVEAIVTASSTAAVGSYPVVLLAYGASGNEVTTTLTVNVVDTSVPAPVIMEDVDAQYGVDWNHCATVSSLGDEGKATFQGRNISFWSYGSLPTWLNGIDLSYNLEGDATTCEVTVKPGYLPASQAASEVKTAAVDLTFYSADIPIYAYNEVGDMASSTLKVYLADVNSTPQIATASKNQSVSVPRGGSATVTFEAERVNSWFAPVETKGLEITFDDDKYEGTEQNASPCTATITASNTLQPNTYSVRIIAMSATGDDATGNPTWLTDETTLTVTVTRGSGGHSGCDVGLGGLGALALALLIARKRG